MHAQSLRRAGVAAATLMLAWLGLAHWGAPLAIEAAYHRTGPAFLNDLITGQRDLTLDVYLGRWASGRGRLTLGVAGALILFMATVPLHARTVQWLGRQLRKPPLVRTMDLVAIGGLIGWIVGLLEAGRETLRWAGQPSGPGWEVLWMGPTAGAAAAVLLALLIALPQRRSGPALRSAVALLGTVFSLGFLRAAYWGIHPAAAGILALGVGIQLSRSVAVRAPSVVSASRRLLPALLALSLVSAAGYKATEAVGERRADASLGPAPADAASVLILVMDTQRQSRMSLHGNPRQTTPNIDRFASRSITFDEAYATSSWTLPSHASLFTGRWYNELSAGSSIPLSDGPTTLAEVMREREYRTGAFMANELYTAARSGLSRGFGTYRDNPVDLEAWVASNRVARWITAIVQRAAGVHSVSRVSAEDVNEEFLGWLDREDRPFFAVLNYFDLHFPYEAPAPFDTRFVDPAPRYWLPGWGVDWDYEQEPRYSDAFVAEIVDSYDSSLAYLDHHIGLLLERLEERGLLDRTVVVLTSDHGEAFGEKGIISHSKSLYRPEMHVPLVISHPAWAAEGTRVQATVSIRDIAQTVLDLVGIEDDRILGRSLRRHWEGSGGVAPESEPEILLTQIRARPWYQPGGRVLDGDLNGAIRGSLHYIRNALDGEELFDVTTDPGQLQNLAPDPAHADQLEVLRSAVENAPGVRFGGGR